MEDFCLIFLAFENSLFASKGQNVIYVVVVVVFNKKYVHTKFYILRLGNGYNFREITLSNCLAPFQKEQLLSFKDRHYPNMPIQIH